MQGEDLVPDVFLRITLIEGYVEFLKVKLKHFLLSIYRTNFGGQKFSR